MEDGRSSWSLQAACRPFSSHGHYHILCRLLKRETDEASSSHLAHQPPALLETQRKLLVYLTLAEVRGPPIA